MEEIFISPANIEDTRKMCELARQLGYICEEEVAKVKIESYLKDFKKTILLAKSKEVVGWCTLSIIENFYMDDYVLLSGLIVDENIRGKGIGKLIIKEAEKWAISKGIYKIQLNANVVRKDAHEFYKKQGFTLKKEQYQFQKSLL